MRHPPLVRRLLLIGGRGSLMEETGNTETLLGNPLLFSLAMPFADKGG